MILEEAINSFWESTRQGIYYPPEWKGKLSVDEGYRIQLGLLERHLKAGEKQAGWKVGLTAQPIREQLDYHEPVFGFLLKNAHQQSGAVIEFETLLAPCFETELCLVLGQGLKGPHVTLEEARAAIASVQPALEIVERRGDFTADLALAMADNTQQKFFVTGAAMPLPKDVLLSSARVEVVVNGEQVDEATGDNVLGDPAASLVWLANRLAQYGHSLEEGMRIMSGSFTKQHPVGQGDLIEAHFHPFGVVEAEFC